MKIRIDLDDISAIDAFVAGRPDAAQGHRTAWLSVLRDGLKHRPIGISAWRDGQVVGWLPLAVTRSIFFGRRLVSLPYVNEAGVLAEDSQIAAALIDRAAEFARAEGIAAVELRNHHAIETGGLDRICEQKVRMVLPLRTSADALWNAIPSKARNQVRKGQKNNLTVRGGGAELLGGFYDVFATNMRDLGTPVLPRALFAAMVHHLGADAEIVVVETGGKPIAGSILVHGRGVTEVPSASSLRRYNDTSANMLMYWGLMERAIARGSTTFDFGRSTEGSGPHLFKKQWGALAEPTGWQQLQLTAASQPLRREDQRFSMAIELWKRLPLWFTRQVGPSIARGIP